MNIKRKWLKLIKDEIKSPLTTEVLIKRDLDTEGMSLIITIKQIAPVEYFGTSEMRNSFEEATK